MSSRELALSSQQPIRLGERCTVFMERDVNDCLRRGAALEDLVAGLAYSVVDQLHQSRRARPPASARRSSSRAAPPTTTPWPRRSAPSSASGSSCRPFNGVMGALGVALLAREKMARSSAEHAVPRLRPARGRLRDLRVHLPRLHQLLPDAAGHRRGPAHLLGRQVLGALPQGRPRRARARNRGPRRAAAARLLDGYAPEAGHGPVVGLPLCHVDLRLGAVLARGVPLARGARAAFGADPTTTWSSSGIESTVSEPCFPWSSPTATSGGCSTSPSTSSFSRTTSPRPATRRSGPASSAPGTRRCRSWRARRRPSSSSATG